MRKTMLNILRASVLVLVAAVGFLTWKGVDLNPFSARYNRPDVEAQIGGRYETLDSTHHRLEVEWIEGPIDPGAGGAIDAWGDGMIAFTRLGAFHAWKPGQASFRDAEISAPFDEQVTERFFTAPIDIASAGGKGLAVVPAGAGWEVFVSHTLIREDRGCIVLAVSRARLVADEEGWPVQEGEWEVIYETEPCLEASGAEAFLLQSGGALDAAADGTLVLQVGDFARDGLHRTEGRIPVSQDPAFHHGKVIRIDPATRSGSVLSMGHRNSGGITVDDRERVWLLEHGPRGGDELNLIREGANYGWPEVTLGAEYSRFFWPLSDEQGRHTGFEPPVHAWLPSRAVQGLVQIRGDAIPAWDGDLIGGSLAGQSLLHIRLG